jgi:hypothetical protein
MISHTFRRGLVASFVLGLSVTNALSAQGPNTAAFRAGLVVTPMRSNNGPMDFLQWVALRWPVYSAGTRYRVLRAAAPNGPWVLEHEVAGVVDTIPRMPPSVVVYFRVVALHQETMVKSIALDTTNMASTTTVASTMVGTIGGYSFSISGLCSVTPPSTVKFSWARVPNANGYRLRVLLLVPSDTSTTVPQPSVLVRDTVLVQTNVVAGKYTYVVEPQYDIANWPGPGQTLSLYGPGLVRMRVNVGPGMGPGCG